MRIGAPKFYHSGNLEIFSYPGADAKTHSGQLLVALPAQLSRLMSRLGHPPSSPQLVIDDRGETVPTPAGGAVTSCPVPRTRQPGTLARMTAAIVAFGLVGAAVYYFKD